MKTNSILEISKALSELAIIYDSNMKQLTKLLKGATEYVKENNDFLIFWYSSAGPRSRGGAENLLIPPKYAFSVFGNKTEKNDDPQKSDCLIVFMILLNAEGTNEFQDYITFNIMFYDCKNREGLNDLGNEWIYQAMVSMKRKDIIDYSISEWSNKIVKAIYRKSGNVSYIANIPISSFKSEDDFPTIIKPIINSIINKNSNDIKDIDLYTPF